jgi:hypothetical protein
MSVDHNKQSGFNFLHTLVDIERPTMTRKRVEITLNVEGVSPIFVEHLLNYVRQEFEGRGGTVELNIVKPPADLTEIFSDLIDSLSCGEPFELEWDSLRSKDPYLSEYVDLERLRQGFDSFVEAVGAAINLTSTKHQ